MRVFNWIRNVLFVAAIAVIIASLACFAMDIRPSIVLSDSMKPAFEKGGAVFVGLGSSYEIGDAVAFYSGSVYATHRLVDIEEENGQTYYITRGDNNRDMTERHLKEDIVGKVLFYIPYVGYILAFAGSRKGIVIFGTVIICLILSVFMTGHKEKAGDQLQANTASPAQAENSLTEDFPVSRANDLLYRLLWESHFDMLEHLEKRECIRDGFIEREKAAFTEEPVKNGYERLYYRHFAVLELLKKKGIAEESMLAAERARFPEPV